MFAYNVQDMLVQDKHAVNQWFEARSRTSACRMWMTHSYQEQDSCNHSFGSSIGYWVVTLQGPNHWKAIECVEVKRYTVHTGFQSLLNIQKMW